MSSKAHAVDPMPSRYVATVPRPAVAATLPVPRSVGVSGTMHDASADHPLVALIQRFLNPVIMALTLLALTRVFEHNFYTVYLAMAGVVFFLGVYAVTEFPIAPCADGFLVSRSTRRLLVQWMKLAGILLFVGFAAKISSLYSRKVLLAWFVLTPFALMIAQTLARRAIQRFAVGSKYGARKIIVGANDLAYQLARRIDSDPLHGSVIGFFDDRESKRLPEQVAARMLGRLDDLPDYVRRNKVDAIYIALPALARPRLVQLLSDLQDTTASVYLVPDVFVFDPVRMHVEDIGGIPAIAMRETPLRGINSVVKRISDLVVSVVVLALIWPVMLLIAAGVKMSSPGPVLFRQRRYGLDGSEIMVYKFRSMSVCEDGERIRQARKHDPRVTRFGQFLRKTSLDELPQFLNVLQGSMSVVGPRPHAVAHNELYRKMIPNYMFRHKVKPGITGWAQVNGLRGETDTLGKMKARLHYDLEYLRIWSAWLDLWIIMKTAVAVVHDRGAY